MADIKQMSFMLLVLLVSVSALYEWTKEDEVLNRELGVDAIEGFKGTTLTDNLNEFQIATDDLITTIVQVDLLSLVGALSTFLGIIWGFFMKLMFGWTILVAAIFDSIGLKNLDLVFTAPLAVLQMLAAFYFLRDLVNTVRGVGG